jgi:uncharacterized glyoxalase superfamily protein PhnB
VRLYWTSVLCNGSARSTRGTVVGMTDTAPPPNVWPTLTAPRDAGGLIKFLVDAFGFEAVVVYGEGDHVDHAELSWPLGGGVMLGSAGPAGARRRVPAARARVVRLLCGHRRCGCAVQARHGGGAEVVRELNDTDYGSRDVGFRDPEGNRWSFGTYRGHPRS